MHHLIHSSPRSFAPSYTPMYPFLPSPSTQCSLVCIPKTWPRADCAYSVAFPYIFSTTYQIHAHHISISHFHTTFETHAQLNVAAHLKRNVGLQVASNPGLERPCRLCTLSNKKSLKVQNSLPPGEDVTSLKRNVGLQVASNPGPEPIVYTLYTPQTFFYSACAEKEKEARVCTWWAKPGRGSLERLSHAGQRTSHGAQTCPLSALTWPFSPLPML